MKIPNFHKVHCSLIIATLAYYLRLAYFLNYKKVSHQNDGAI